jgi:predicted aspartyl protease
MIDTGFDGALVVTEDQALELNLESMGPSVVRWFDGTETAVELARGQLDWFGNLRECTIHVARRGFTLIGMEFLRETRIGLEYSIDRVEVTYLGQQIFDPNRKWRT